MSRGKKLLFVSVLLAVTAVLAEGLVRIGCRLGGEPYSSAQTHREIEVAMRSFRESLPREAVGTAESDDGRRTILHPYYGFERNTKKFHSAITMLRQEPQDNEYRIVVFGGSVALGFVNRARARLEEQLARSDELRGREVSVYKYAHAGFKQPQQAAALAFLLTLGARFDAVINLDGVNEVALGAMNSDAGAHPLFPDLAHWGVTTAPPGLDAETLDPLLDMRSAERRSADAGERALRFGFAHSAMLGKFALALQARYRRSWAAAYERYQRSLERDDDGRIFRGPPRDERTDELDTIVWGWAESSRSMQAMCRARGMSYLHVLQPTLHDRGSKPLTDEEREVGAAAPVWVDAAERGYPRLREAGQALRASGVSFVDASLVFRGVTITLYYDHCHFGDEGNRRLADAIVPGFLECLERPKPGGGR